MARVRGPQSLYREGRARSVLSKEGLPRFRKRLLPQGVNDLVNTSDSLVYEYGQFLSGWRHGAGDRALRSAEETLLALVEVCRELRRRSGQ